MYFKQGTLQPKLFSVPTELSETNSEIKYLRFTLIDGTTLCYVIWSSDFAVPRNACRSKIEVS